MSIEFNIFLPGETEAEDTFSAPVPVVDAMHLFSECMENGVETDWWADLANTITMRGGKESSVAYLLLFAKDLGYYTVPTDAGDDPNLSLWSKFKNRITLSSAYRNGQITIDGWGIVNATAVDGSRDLWDPYTVYLVELRDIRYLAARQPGFLEVTRETDETSASLKEKRLGYNIVSQTRSAAGMSFNSEDPNQFPYDLKTLKGETDPYSWTELLEELWKTCCTDGSDPPDATAAVWPIKPPIDIRVENRSAWDIYCDVLHSCGNEIYPKVDGTFYLQSIDTAYAFPNGAVGLESNFLVEEAHPHPGWRRIPSHSNISFQARNRDVGKDNINPYWCPKKPLSTITDLALTQTTAKERNFYIVPSTEDETNGYTGSAESFLTFGKTAVWDASADTDDPKNKDELEDFALTVLTKYMKHRVAAAKNQTYGTFLAVEPSVYFGEITWYFDPDGGPSTNVRTVIVPIGVDALPSFPGGVTGGGGNTELLIVLIEEDIPGIEEDPTVALKETELEEPATLEDPKGTKVSELPLWAYARTTHITPEATEQDPTPTPYELRLKYYRRAGEDDPGYISDNEGTADFDESALQMMILVTEETEEEVEGQEEKQKFIRYATIPVVYDDGKPFNVGEYARGDYPDYDENAEWPPPDLPDKFLNKRYRAVAIKDQQGNYVITSIFCKALPPPELPE